MQSKNLSCFDLILEIKKVSRESHDVAALVPVGGRAVGIGASADWPSVFISVYNWLCVCKQPITDRRVVACGLEPPPSFLQLSTGSSTTILL